MLEPIQHCDDTAPEAILGASMQNVMAANLARQASDVTIKGFLIGNQLECIGPSGTPVTATARTAPIFKRAFQAADEREFSRGLWAEAYRNTMILRRLTRHATPASRELIALLCAALIGLAAFVFYTGGAIVRPTSIEWLMRGDFAQHFLGWNFFRHAPLLQFPLGTNWNYGESLSSSIVFTDSTPLFAFLFRPIASLLPEPFQYIGIWLALTLMLQGIFAYKLLSLFSKQRLAVLLATAFFVIAPPLWWRINIESDALSAHWLILAALYLYFKDKYSGRSGIVLLWVAALTHAYLLAMVLAIWAANLLQRWLKGQMSYRGVAGYGLASAASLAFVMWATGYFMVHSGLSYPSALNFYRMNLLSLVDPMGLWSTVLPNLPRGGGEYEASCYLGSGMLLLVVVLAPLAWLAGRRRQAAYGGYWATLVPLGVLAAGLTVLALTNQIAWGNHLVLSYRMPAGIESLIGVFRAAGRMFWPVYYLIYVAVFYAAFKLIGRKVLPCLLALLLILQLIDSHSATQDVRRSMQNNHWQSPLKSAFWQQAPTMYDRVSVALPFAFSFDFDYFPLALFASNHRLAIDNGYFARIDMGKLAALQRRKAQIVFSGVYDPRTLYVFGNDPIATALWEQAKINTGPDDVMGKLDGYRILAPGWRHCVGCFSFDQGADRSAGPAPKPYALGTPIDFRRGGNADSYIDGGWYPAEPWGRWTFLSVAALWLALPTHIEGDLTLDISGRAYVLPNHPQQTITVSVNGQTLGDLRYTVQANPGTRQLRIPAALVSASHGRLLILLHMADATSPQLLMESRDDRVLGLGATEMRIH